MSSTRDPRRILELRIAASAGVGAVALALTAWWAFAPVTAPPTAMPSTAPPAAPGAPPIDRDRWAAVLWRPFTDQVAVAAPSAPPPNVRLFSIMGRDRAAVAALDLGGADGLVYLKAGESSGVVTVTAIDRASATVLVAGRSVRLEMAP